jgi:sugar phosphate isomerase/epimerase
VRRRAEESNYFGLDTVFIAAEVNQAPDAIRWSTPAIGAGFSQERLDEFVELLTEAAEILRAEGIRPGLHNHVGTWVETEHEIDYVLENVDASLLGASFDIGHLEWAGIDAKRTLEKWSDRLLDLHIKDLDLDLARETREKPRSYEVATDQGLYREPGLGQLDIIDTLSALPDRFDGWVIIEVDRASMDPVASARHTAAWLAEVTAA